MCRDMRTKARDSFCIFSNNERIRCIDKASHGRLPSGNTPRCGSFAVSPGMVPPLLLLSNPGKNGGACSFCFRRQ